MIVHLLCNIKTKFYEKYLAFKSQYSHVTNSPSVCAAIPQPFPLCSSQKTSLNRGVHSTDRGVHSTDRGVHSTDRGVHSTHRGVQSTDRGIHSTGRGVHTTQY